ncbi:glycosyltransferase [Flammeovirga yaeyamensis]|uniref:Glycosyltransferase n=1 Tax=Flammeovirga yaeyamensis TaxID=367791 RepID=A0AAX1MZN3_9BACT|nr:glycosyltransferase [Flammeovirga yaeyamensis]MBB3700965.1 poly(glycerol-phosphate) alpha-glucosyltransferase [Flammeovirga yaeyamensis]NMF38072.1 glycosyltransferase [Flammeovirga yaeyamensis]QWG00721.1 glycosyltransferase [Flammeovirga yaeyamensis]
MKILIISGSNSRQSGGLFFSVKSLSKALLNNDIQLSLLTHNDKYSEDDINTYGDIPMPIYDVFGPNNLGFSKNISKKIKDVSPTLIHQQCIWMYLSYAVLKTKRKFKTKTIITPRGMLDPWAVNNSKLKKRIIGFLYENENLRNADCFHALCLSEYESIRSFGLKNPVAIIPNGINLPKIQNRSFDDNWKINTKKAMTFIGRIHPKKGVKELVEALYILKKNKSSLLDNWTIYICGWDQNGHIHELQDLTKKYKLEEDIVFLGSVYGDKKDSILFHSQSFILPSFSEGLPMSILEAWSFKLPVLMTEECNLSIGFHKKTSYKISNDPPTLAKQLDIFGKVSDSELIEFGNNAFNLVKENYTWEKIADMTNKMYQWVENKKVPKPDFIYLD